MGDPGEALARIRYGKVHEKVAAIWTLRGQTLNPEALAEILKHVGSGPFLLRYAATVVAAQSGDSSPPTISALLTLLAGKHVVEQLQEASPSEFSAVGLTNEGTAALVDLMERGLDKGGGFARHVLETAVKTCFVTLIGAAANVHNPDIVARLVNIQESLEVPEIQDAAIRALGMLGDPSTRERLEYLARTNATAARAVAHYGSKPPPATSKTRDPASKSGCFSMLLMLVGTSLVCLSTAWLCFR